MKVSIIILTAVVVVTASTVVVVGLRKTNSAKPMMTTAESPLACNMEALTPAERERHFNELGPALRSLKRSVHELADGYEFEFVADPKTYAMLTEWSFQERACCPFFDIDIRLDREGGPMWMRLTGREGTKEFIKAEAGPWLQQ